MAAAAAAAHRGIGRPAALTRLSRQARRVRLLWGRCHTQVWGSVCVNVWIPVTHRCVAEWPLSHADVESRVCVEAWRSNGL